MAIVGGGFGNGVASRWHGGGYCGCSGGYWKPVKKEGNKKKPKNPNPVKEEGKKKKNKGFLLPRFSLSLSLSLSHTLSGLVLDLSQFLRILY
ncbi:hypothetical protein CMV_029040 [Castanea mollissima]|uniref:Uncharacterized protein n=1 Tax=Castanea mollissima TaxID=60419 RepID=A0A8J4Q847_9ROSI|nr:hypothetical protein CMV_029040 [Castanea mollissima]